jgi:hypothetical protein
MRRSVACEEATARANRPYRDFRDSLEAAAKYFSDDEVLQAALPTALRRLAELTHEEEDEQPPQRRRGASESYPKVSGALTEIFSDVDEE